MPKIGDLSIEDDSVHRLGYHKVTDETLPMHAQVRRHFQWLDTWLIQNLPAGREQSCARTALQEASMWSNAAIACNLAPVHVDPDVYDEA